MLFNSLTFVLFFLPLCLVCYYATARLAGPRAAGWALVLFSFGFYGWWDIAFVPLLAGSILFNYTVGNVILRYDGDDEVQKPLLFFGILANILLLFYFKYLFPLMHWLDSFGFNLTPGASGVVLPLGISFFTFTQIGYLVDCQAGLVKERKFLNYALFVTFFPHLIAGPIVHHKEMIPQFADRRTYRLKAENIAVGLVIFIMGLFKKVVIADHFAPLAKAAFASPDHLTAFAAWGGVLSYSLQLYFDFSGYSDMAIGLARLFGVWFPANFNSPYKATSIIEYWQRWHMTLTRYLNLYIYNPIALRVARRRMAAGKTVSKEATKTLDGFTGMIVFPTMVTITLAGIWHGAGWQFFVFGVLHGIYLCINHAARAWLPKLPPLSRFAAALVTVSKVVLTYLAVVIAQVFFRAASVPDALAVLKGMLGFSTSLPQLNINPTYDFMEELLRGCGYDLGIWLRHMQFDAPFTLLLGFLVVWSLPNTMQIMAGYRPSLSKIGGTIKALAWRPTAAWGLGIGFMATVAVLAITGTKEFLYFQF